MIDFAPVTSWQIRDERSSWTPGFSHIVAKKRAILQFTLEKDGQPYPRDLDLASATAFTMIGRFTEDYTPADVFRKLAENDAVLYGILDHELTIDPVNRTATLTLTPDDTALLAKPPKKTLSKAFTATFGPANAPQNCVGSLTISDSYGATTHLGYYYFDVWPEWPRGRP